MLLPVGVSLGNTTARKSRDLEALRGCFILTTSCELVFLALDILDVMMRERDANVCDFGCHLNFVCLQMFLAVELNSSTRLGYCR